MKMKELLEKQRAINGLQTLQDLFVEISDYDNAAAVKKIRDSLLDEQISPWSKVVEKTVNAAEGTDDE